MHLLRLCMILGLIPLALLSGQPNIVLIMVDDMGFSDIGPYGSEIRTPNLDSLAAAGVRFTQFYNAGRCCPTRASLLTGLYPHQAGVGYMEPANRYNRPIVERLRAPQYQGYLNRGCVTIAEVLRSAGYQTFMTGKWHVGAAATQRPWERGFDRYFGILAGSSNHFRPGDRLYCQDRQCEAPPDFYTTDYFSRYAARFIEEASRERPFFLYVAFTAPHWPIQAWPEDIERYRRRYDIGWDELRRRRFARQKELGLFPPELKLSPRDAESYPWEEADQEDMSLRMAVFAAMIDRVDQGVGRILSALRQTGEERDTLVLFLSDNGGCAEPYGRNRPSRLPPGPAESETAYYLPWANASNTPFRLFKHWAHEGGIATPLIASWPGKTPMGVINAKQIGHVKDIMATCLEAAGVKYPAVYDGRPVQPIEGRSLLPAMLDAGAAANHPIYWEHEGNRAVRDGRWKLVSCYNEVREQTDRVGTGRRTGKWELYDMLADRTELRNLADVYPRKAEELARKHEEWSARVGVIDWEELLRLGGFDQPSE